MRKLNIKKIRWIVKEVERREIGVWSIAKQQKITPRWARELPKKYRGKEIILKKPGRKTKPIPSDERKLVIDTYNEYLVGATMIERNQRCPRRILFYLLYNLLACSKI